MAALIRRFWVVLALVMVAPSVLSYTPYQPHWDDTYFLHRAVSMQRAVWHLDARQWAETFSILVKSPLMAFLGLAGFGVIRLALVILLWGLIFTCFHVLLRMGVPWWGGLLGAAAVGCDPGVTQSAGLYLADLPVSWAILLLLLLIPYEAGTVDHSRPASIARGLMWGFVMSVGLLGKVTFWPLLALAGPVVVFTRWRRGGGFLALAVCLIVSAPALVIVARYHRQFLEFAWSSTAGVSAQYHASGPASLGAILLAYTNGMGVAPYLAAALLIAALAVRRRASDWLPLALLLLYALPVIMSPARDFRYFLPVAISLPFLLAAIPSKGSGEAPRLATWWFAAAVLVSLPMAWRMDLTAVQEVQALLEACSGHGLSDIVLATDSSRRNIETFRLARELSGSPIRIHAVVYGDAAGRPLDDDLAELASAGAVVFESPVSTEPDAINVRVPHYRAFVSVNGERALWSPGSFEVFVHR